MDYDSMTVLSLKTLCKERGLRVSGTKAEVIIRLMENDEGSLPAPQQVTVQQMQQMQPQIIHIAAPSNENTVGVIFGIFIILYGIFRIGIAMLYSGADEGVFFFESFIAWLIGMSFIASGVFTIMGFRNGLFMAIGILLISGVLNIMYHDEFSPLSMGLDGFFPLGWSLMCSSVCIVMVLIPIMAGENLKPGWPEGIQNIFDGMGMNNQSTQSLEKITLECPHCEANIRLPAEYSGNARCPSCKEEFTVE
ncbi:MAG: SAP domain-containing protein [Candidatus Poseidoniaceae archaeon]|jgi:hypothetical protein|nr:SAP domain-containing protein [Candidatus Poseidoniaceae archaeon]